MLLPYNATYIVGWNKLRRIHVIYYSYMIAQMF